MENHLTNKIPSFGYPGGKTKALSFVTQYFPSSGNWYIEPFAGRGNVFFYVRSKLNFKNFWINDINTSNFFNQILTADLSKLPDLVSKDDFYRLKANRDDPYSVLLEPRVTFGCKGYDNGYSGDYGNHIGYRKHTYFPKLVAARDLLKDVKITNTSWESINYNTFGPDDFIYFDPPYYNTKISSYGNINHEELLKILKMANFRWVLSGYDSDLYRSVIGPPKGTKDQAAHLAALNGKSGERRAECVWTNL